MQVSMIKWKYIHTGTDKYQHMELDEFYLCKC